MVPQSSFSFRTFNEDMGMKSASLSSSLLNDEKRKPREGTMPREASAPASHLLDLIGHLAHCLKSHHLKQDSSPGSCAQTRQGPSHLRNQDLNSLVRGLSPQGSGTSTALSPTVLTKPGLSARHPWLGLPTALPVPTCPSNI